MATDKALRTPPDRTLDRYVMSVQKLFSAPETIPDSAFLKGGNYAITWDSSVTVGGLGPAEGYSVSEPIGFDFKINGKIYKEFSVSTSGWMMLRDPVGGSTGANFYKDVIDDPVTFSDSVYTNEFILSDFLYDHIILAPWFDYGIISARSIEELQAGYYSSTISEAIKNYIKQGSNVKNWPYDFADHGVRYINGYDKSKGKYLLVRWTLAQNISYAYKLKFEVAIFESGRIEYRYWPKSYYEPSSFSSADSTATVGIFWSGPSQGTDKFRDLATLFDYSKKNRVISEFGGSPPSSYSETSLFYPLASKKYSLNISQIYWPANGAVITISPPVNSIKVLPRKLSSIANSTKHLVRSPGIFDDRRSINFATSSIVSMPSTFPSRLLGDSGTVDIASRQLLFTSGNIQINGSVKRTIVDDQLQQLSVLESLNERFESSFNESQKNFSATQNASNFYATGSSLEIFGNGFTSPLKSKTQFNFCLPVTKQTTMPSSTASFYYYDARNAAWSMADPNGYRNPEAMVALAGSPEYMFFSYKVTETSRGFDAVGRKLVSGTNQIDFSRLAFGISTTPTYQTDDSIGAIFNIDAQSSFGNNELIDTSTTKKYSNSVTNNPSFYPSNSQTISFPTDYPFLIEKIVVDVPMYFSGEWFNDMTTCTRAFGNDGAAKGVPSGSIDFGGPGLTFAIMCPRRNGDSCYVDLIASGTITHMNDNTSSVTLYKDPEMRYYSMRPVGFKAFSNPTCVVSGTNNIFEGNVKLELEASIAGGITLARNDRSLFSSSITPNYEISNRESAIRLLTSPTLKTRGESLYNTYDNTLNANYYNRSPRIYIQQVSPLSRGSSGMEFNGNSIIGGNIANFNLESQVKNPLYVSSSGSLPNSFTNVINSSHFNFEAVSVYSTVDSRPSPYLIYPGDKLTFAMSKTRPVIYKAIKTGNPGLAYRYETYQLTGSHGTVMFNTGSINVTVYGSYVREGTEFNP